MNRYSLCVRTLLTLSVVLGCVSVSQAGLFGRWRASYYEQAYCAPTVVATTYAPAVASASPAPASPAGPASTAGPMAYTAAKPVISENAAGVSAPVSQGGYYAPAPGVVPSGTWSTTPRSSWDFGKYPPYH